jgi:ferredoxin
MAVPVPILTVEGTGVSVQLRPGETILAALHRCGYSYRTGCTRGGCGICKVELVNGTATYPVTIADTVLTPAERAGGICLSCRAVPVTDTTIELQSGDRLRSIAPFLTGLLRPASTSDTGAQGDH